MESEDSVRYLFMEQANTFHNGKTRQVYTPTTYYFNYILNLQFHGVDQIMTHLSNFHDILSLSRL